MTEPRSSHQPSGGGARRSSAHPAPGVGWGVLGEVWVTVGDERLALSRQMRHVLGLLLRQPGRAVPVEQLVRPSPSATTEQVVSAARAAMSRLRAALAPSLAGKDIVTSPAGYLLAVDPATVDHVAFDAQVREAQTTEWPAAALRVLERALALWKGEPFGELAGEPEFHAAALALEEQHRAAVDAWCELAVDVGVTAGIVGKLEAAVGEEPFREKRWEALVLAHYRAGDQAAAIRTYERARTMLRDELGVEPGPGLRTLLSAVLEHDPRLAWKPERSQTRPRGSAAVARPMSLVGRDTEVDDLVQLLGRNRAVVITGYGGIGKTSLAMEVATRFPAAAWVVPITDMSDPARLLPTVAAGMGIAAHGPDLVGRVAAHLDDSAGVLVFDACEHLSDHVSALIGELLGRALGGRVLATSRVELDVGGAFTFALGPLPTGSADAPGAAALIAADSALIRPSEIAAHWAVIEHLCRRADGVPLALELLGAAHADRAEPADEGALALGDAVQVALGSLPAESRFAVDVLRVLPGEVAVSFLGDLTSIGAGAARRALGPAVRAGLVVQRTSGTAGTRARLLEPVREHLVDDPELAAVLVKDLHRGFIDLATAASPGLVEAIDATKAAELDDEHELGMWLLERLAPEDQLDLACRMVPVWRACGRHVDGQLALARLEPTAAHASELLQARYWVARAQMSPALADRMPLIEQLRAAKDTAERARATDLAARAAAELAVGLGWAGQAREAGSLIAALLAATPEQNRWAHLALRSLVAMGRGVAGDAGAARELLDIGRAYRDVGHNGDVAGVLYTAASLAAVAGDADVVDQVLAEADHVPLDRFSAFPMAGLCLERARRAVALGDPAAGPLLWDAYGLLQAHGEQRVAAICRRELGAWRLAEGDPDGVSDLAWAALGLLRRDPHCAAVAVARIARATELGASLAPSVVALAGSGAGIPLDADERAEVEHYASADPALHDDDRLVEVLRSLAHPEGRIPSLG